jgi:uncharacterized protein YdaU (DUF1376 family)
MHYYKRNLGDYAKKAGRLSMLQHGSYTLLIDACYDREQFPTLEEAIEWTWASTTEEIEAVTFVLRKFFTLENGVYVQKRIQEEIAEYHGKAETNKRIAIERETKRKENITKRAEDKTNRERDDNEPPPNHKPLTTNQEPLTKNQEPTKSMEVITNSDESNIVSAEKTAPKQKGKALDADWLLPKAWGEWALTEKPELNADQVRSIADDFKDYWIANANQAKAKKADWQAAWRVWVRKSNTSNVVQYKSAGQQRIENTNKAVDEFLGGNNKSTIIEGEYQHA